MVTIADEDDDSVTGKKEAKRPRQKKASKAELRREERERERLQKDKLFKEKVMQELAERDDNSSTTTETSSLDPDDKVILHAVIMMHLLSLYVSVVCKQSDN